MKYQPRNIAQNPAKNQPVFSEKTMAELRLKLRQFVEIEYLNHSKKKNQVGNEKCNNLYKSKY
jgi:hypothetical protein